MSWQVSSSQNPMNGWPAHECPRRSVQGDISYRQTLQEQGDPLVAQCVDSVAGRVPHVASKAAVRAEVLSWGLGDSKVDPGEVLLRLVTQSAARADNVAAPASP